MLPLAPEGTLSFGVLVNHGVELLVPFAYFAPQPLCAIAGILTLIFQGLLSVSGNFAWLGFLTMVLAFSTLSDTQLAFFLPLTAPPLRPPAPVHRHAILAVTALVVLLSYYPVHNMLSRRQVMNAPYNPFHLVSTYGAFGSINRRRYEVIIEGTAETHLTPATPWREYEFMGKPGDVRRRPPQIAPYHLRLDWLLWFLPFHLEETSRGIILPYGYEPWFVHFLAKLLQGDRAVLQLLEHNPFLTSRRLTSARCSTRIASRRRKRSVKPAPGGTGNSSGLTSRPSPSKILPCAPPFLVVGGSKSHRNNDTVLPPES